ncbi:hypothetical protein J1605_010930 [Eschrichtius robustus]|uniref:Uncharacterized protein n=1 Tax=Eschrichtius robustus TaxID=9764 RepID=A0AB34GRQ0_ESCRO|nr:hypothetical protein J1605_010930 [Eschrichtius robustus]
MVTSPLCPKRGVSVSPGEKTPRGQGDWRCRAQATATQVSQPEAVDSGESEALSPRAQVSGASQPAEHPLSGAGGPREGFWESPQIQGPPRPWRPPGLLRLGLALSWHLGSNSEPGVDHLVPPTRHHFLLSGWLPREGLGPRIPSVSRESCSPMPGAM